MKTKILVGLIGIFILIAAAITLFQQSNTGETKGIVLILGGEGPIPNVVNMILDQRGGSINGLEIEIRILDYSESENITEQGVIGILGLNSSGLSREVIPIANEVNVPVMSHLATWPGLTRAGFSPGEPGIYYPTGQRNFFRTVPGDDQQGAAAALWLDQQGVEQVYIFSTEGLYSEGLAGVFIANAGDFELEIVGHDIINIEQFPSDMSPENAIEFVAPYVADLLAAEPDALYFPIAGATLPYINAYLSAILAERPDLIIIGGDGLSQIDLTGNSDLQGIFATDVVPTFEITEAAETFRTDYLAIYGEEPPSWALSLYDGTNAFFDAVERAAEPDPQLILNELNSFESFEGVLGTWNFDQSGDINLNAISLRQLQDGNWQFVETIR